MPTPPWHGHLLRGITKNVSRKRRDTPREAVAVEATARSHSSLIACGMPNGEDAYMPSIQLFINIASFLVPGARRNLLSNGKNLPAQYRP
jgi:hypothetical protein